MKSSHRYYGCQQLDKRGKKRGPLNNSRWVSIENKKSGKIYMVIRSSSIKWALKKKAKGLCSWCGKEPLVNKSHCVKCSEKHRKKSRGWYRANPEKAKESMRKYREKNIEKFIKYQRKYYIKYKGKVKALR